MNQIIPPKKSWTWEIKPESFWFTFIQNGTLFEKVYFPRLIIFTQILHVIYDFKSALKTCYRILKPGGCLLLTVPGISHIDQGEWKDFWLWSFIDTSVKRLMADTFNGSPVNIKTYGNVYVAAAFLYGMGLPEFRKDFLFHQDPSYQVIISAIAVKA